MQHRSDIAEAPPPQRGQSGGVLRVAQNEGGGYKRKKCQPPYWKEISIFKVTFL